MAELMRPKPPTIQYSLKVGETYVVNGESMKLVNLTNYFARFEKNSGTHECFLFQDLGNSIKIRV